MWSSRAFAQTSRLAASAALTCLFTSTLQSATETTICEKQHEPSPEPATTTRRRHTLRQAQSQQQEVTLRKRATKVELDKLRPNQQELLRTWQRDEEQNWRNLPARAWPAYQPDQDEVVLLQTEAQSKYCLDDRLKTPERLQACQVLLFHIATGQVFYSMDPESGLQTFEKLASSGHVDSMVAAGIVLVEGLGVPADETKGVAYLRQAADTYDSAQACYELATCYYIGIEGVLAEDPEAAFFYFKRAADKGHTAALYMMADCFVEGEGVEQSVAKAVPLYFRAAEQGHRFSRQRIRELLNNPDYKK
jgi:TPR repeat protein